MTPDQLHEVHSAGHLVERLRGAPQIDVSAEVGHRIHRYQQEFVRGSVDGERRTYRYRCRTTQGRRFVCRVPTDLSSQRRSLRSSPSSSSPSSPTTYSNRRTCSHRHPPPRVCTIQKLLVMSLPRSNYDPRRVCLNPFPALNLGKHRRTIGVYLAGGLVCLLFHALQQ